MLKANEVEFLASIVNSFICRRPLILEVERPETSQELRQVLSLVPDHRWLLVAGMVPRWMKHLPSQPRELPSNDKEELVSALMSTFEEERMGRRPVQFLYFGADAETYETILKPLPRGWLAITEDAQNILNKFPSGEQYYVRESGRTFRVFHLGDEPPDMVFETKLLEKIVGRRKTSVAYLVQKKLAEMYLAGTAILNELEGTHGTFTLVDLEELFELDGPTVEKEFELVQAERALDLRRYVTMPSPEQTSTLDKVSKIPHVVAAAVVEKGKVIGLRRVKHTETPVSRMAGHLGRLLETLPEEDGLGGSVHLKMVLSEGSQVVAIKSKKLVYVVLLTGDSNLAINASELVNLLGDAPLRQ